MSTWKCYQCEEEYKKNHNVGLTNSITNKTLCIKCHNKGYNLNSPKLQKCILCKREISQDEFNAFSGYCGSCENEIYAAWLKEGNKEE